MSRGLSVLADGVELGLDEDLGCDHRDQKDCREGREERSESSFTLRPLLENQEACDQGEGVGDCAIGAEVMEGKGLD